MQIKKNNNLYHGLNDCASYSYVNALISNVIVFGPLEVIGGGNGNLPNYFLLGESLDRGA